MYYAHPAHASPSAQGSQLLVLVGLILFTLGLVVIAVRSLRAERRALRACPVCAAVAVRALSAEELGGGLVRLRAQCGQCGIWRRALTSEPESKAYERALERDRRHLGDEALRLVRRRLRHDRRAFVRALRSDVVGADDFLARARRRTAALPRRGLS